MIISDAQAKLATEHLRHQAPVAPSPHPEVSSDLLRRVMREVAEVPDTREERVAEAREWLAEGDIDAHDVASKMLSRIAADSIR
jgi:anti-sigma28 factor (negative regulator of flagellin synthesis)